MDGDQPISWLMFFTLAAGAVIVGFVFLNFIRSRSNRAVAADTLEGNGTGRGAAPDGALPELAGIAVFALVAMALLATGVNSRNTQTAEVAPPAASGTTGMAQPKNIQNEPKRYQPNNPGTDTRTAPTASDAGVGNSPGSTGTLTK
ncbi:hypothetical protein [Rhodopseudomonas pseudopalustris]|uniref:Uncharacterized protein n=2 Tax=Rhodopseudomonas TaxID=1073 RepID=Q132I9_RHOPS|nr:hypothetical protein [Rhodopseudomonas pseudopalustris]ABE41000.1 conserved hypothetical protein [Rhodopseudomonas palustris BisB5]MBB1092256.1 hypothetical protein [Rhodopseudomonas palustris]SEO62534.1 hypothetical protein SAMN05444123_103532 [Rhodopseudomonas pseudopalustris]